MKDFWELLGVSIVLIASVFSSIALFIAVIVIAIAPFALVFYGLYKLIHG